MRWLLAALGLLLCQAPGHAQVSFGLSDATPAILCVFDRSASRPCVTIGSVDSATHKFASTPDSLAVTGSATAPHFNTTDNGGLQLGGDASVGLYNGFADMALRLPGALGTLYIQGPTGVTRASIDAQNGVFYGGVTGAGPSSFASSLTFTPTSAPFPLDARQFAADVNDIRAWGYRGDATTLAAVTSVGGVDTTGWTLGQWQAALCADIPSTAVTADWAAIQCYLAAHYVAGAANVAQVHLPAGHAYISNPIVFCGRLTFKGADGQTSATRIHYTGAGTDLLRMCIDGNSATFPSLVMGEFSLGCDVVGGCGKILNANLYSYGTPRGEVSHVYVSAPENGLGPWSGGLYIIGSTTFDVSESQFLAGPYGTTYAGDCITFRTSTEIFSSSNMVLRRVGCNYWDAAVHLIVENNTAVEGVYLQTFDSQSVDLIVIECLGANCGVNQINADNVQGAVFRSWLRYINPPASEIISGLTWVGSWGGSSPPDAGQPWGAFTYPANGPLDFTKAAAWQFSRNTFFNSSATPRGVPFMTADGGFGKIYANSFAESVSEPCGWSVWLNILGDGLKVLDERMNTFGGGCPPVLVPNWATAPYIRSENYIASLSTSDVQCMSLPTSGVIFGQGQRRVIQCAGQAAGTTDASGDLAVTFPVGAFTVAPRVTVTNSDALACADAVAAYGTTTAGFTARSQLCLSTSLFVNWVATGY